MERTDMLANLKQSSTAEEFPKTKKEEKKKSIFNINTLQLLSGDLSTWKSATSLQALN